MWLRFEIALHIHLHVLAHVRVHVRVHEKSMPGVLLDCSVLLCFLLLWWNTDQMRPSREWINFILYFQITVHHWKKSGQKLKQEFERQDYLLFHLTLLLTRELTCSNLGGSLLVSCLLSFLGEAMAICLGNGAAHIEIISPTSINN